MGIKIEKKCLGMKLYLFLTVLMSEMTLRRDFWRSALMTMFLPNIWGKELITKANEYAKENKFFLKQREGEYLWSTLFLRFKI